MLTGLLAALASTIDTHLNWGASYWTNDIYKRFICQAWRKTEPSGRALVRVARDDHSVLLVEAHRASGDEWSWRGTFDRLAGTDALRVGIEAGLDAAALTASWDDASRRFESLREPYLIYR